MTDADKLDLLNKELDEESRKYIQDTLNEWKETVTNQLVEQMEKEKQAKLEQLDEENAAYREQLKEEFTDKMLDGLNELKESIRAEVTAEVIKNNPELKILEQVKEVIAPLVSEDYRDNAYEDTITKLSEENERLRREQELQEGARTLATLLAPYSDKTQRLVTSLIKEGSPDEVTEQFYNIIDSLSNLFENDSSEDSSSDDSEDSSSDDSEDSSSDDSEDSSSDDSEDSSSDDSEDETNDESYLNTGSSGDETITEERKYNKLANTLKKYANL